MSDSIPSPSEAIPIEERSKASRALWEIHRASGAPIVADYHIRLFNDFSLPDNATLGDAIDEYVVACDSIWKPVDGIHTFRDREWAMDDPLEIPYAESLRLHHLAERSKVYDINFMLEIAKLSDARILRLDNYRFFPGFYAGFLLDHLENLATLRLWNNLHARQRSLVEEKTGMPVKALSKTQINLLEQGGINIEHRDVIKAMKNNDTLEMIYQRTKERSLKITLRSQLRLQPIQRISNPTPDELNWVNYCPFKR